MKRDDIRDMAREADLDWHKHWDVSWEAEPTNRLERFARLVAAAEREAIALQGEELATAWRKEGRATYSAAVSDFVDAIRKRGAL